jgi:hypothetical protein
VLKPLKHFAKPSNDKVGIVDRFNGIGALGKVSVSGGKVLWSGPELLDSILPLLTILFYVGIFFASLAIVWRVAYGETLSVAGVRRFIAGESPTRRKSAQNKGLGRQQAEQQGGTNSRSRPVAA